jgi:serine phosphatase RsbU (regulator of sigma subunit)
LEPRLDGERSVPGAGPPPVGASARGVEASEGAQGAASVSPPPLALFVGRAGRLAAVHPLGDALRSVEIAADEAAAAVAERQPDLCVLDAAEFGPEALDAQLEGLGRPDAPRRPAVLLLTPAGRRAGVGEALRGPGDDVVNEALGRDELRARLRGALRVRGLVGELQRRHHELEGVSRRLEGLARRMAEELRLASNVQRSLTPPPLRHARLDVAREFIPFREIGGDFYDMVPLGRERIAFAIGDVMGKGVPAALLAASLRSCLRSQLPATGAVDPAAFVARVNRVFCDISPAALFASLFFGVFDLARGRLDYVNAGHHYPFRVAADGEACDLVTGGTVLGLLEDAVYDAAALALRPDDVLVFYSDGLTDRANPDGEGFGIERLKEAARGSRAEGARLTLYSLLGRLQEWSAGTPPDDDQTLIVARVR